MHDGTWIRTKVIQRRLNWLLKEMANTETNLHLCTARHACFYFAIISLHCTFTSPSQHLRFSSLLGSNGVLTVCYGRLDRALQLFHRAVVGGRERHGRGREEAAVGRRRPGGGRS